jgi:hypothetical protein
MDALPGVTMELMGRLDDGAGLSRQKASRVSVTSLRRA